MLRKVRPIFGWRHKSLINHKAVQFLCAINAVLSDLNFDHLCLLECQSIRTYSLKRVRSVVYGTSDEDTTGKEQYYSTLLWVPRRHVKTWRIHTVNKATLLGRVEEIPGINTCMYFIGWIFTYFPFRLEYEKLSFMSSLCTGGSKFCYVTSSSNQSAFDDFLASYTVDHEYLNDYYEGVWQII